MQKEVVAGPENRVSTRTGLFAPGRVKFFIGGALIFAAVIFLIITSTQGNAQYFLTVKELNEKSAQMTGRNLRVSGVVIGNTITNDLKTMTLTFEVAHIPANNDEIEALGGLETVLKQAASDPTLPRLKVVYKGVPPDMLKDEAQAIMTGKLGEDGLFYVDELLLKCPSKYEEAVPSQVVP